MMTLLDILKKITLIIVHLVAIGLMIYCFSPIISWYLNHRPILGVDFYNTATFLTYFKENFHIFQQNYLDFWYGGSPMNSYPILNWFRIFSFTARIVSIFSAVKFTSLAIFFFLIIFVYLGTYRLSKNPFVGFVLAILVMYSSNMYGSLTWGGSLPYFANQLFFPMLLWVFASLQESGNKRWYYFAIIVLGFMIAGHLGNASAFGIPAAFILIFLGSRKQSLSIKQRIKETVIFFVLMELLIYRYFGQFWKILINLFLTLLSGFKLIKLPTLAPSASGQAEAVQVTSDINQQIAEFYRNSFYKIFTDTHPLLLIGVTVAFAIFVVAIIIGRRRQAALSVIAWAALCLYSVLHVYLNANGIGFLSQGWYRAFWQFPVTVAFLIASLVGVSQTLIGSYGRVLKTGIFIIWAALAVFAGAMSFVSHDVEKTIATLESQSSPSSAYPEALNLTRSEADFERLTKSLLPVWMDSKDKNYRLFNDDAQVIIWWNALFDIPLVRGYLDPPGNTNQHHLLDQAIAGDGLVENYKYSPEVARNMALYYLDWYAIKYAEGGHVSQSPNKSPSTYLKDVIAQQSDVETKGVYLLYATKTGKPELHEEVSQYLKYYRFTDEVTSPIVTISNAPTIACFCDFPAYESLLKILSMHNVHSRKLVSLYIPEPIDSYSPGELKNFDTVLLSNYKYKNRTKTFSLLKEYLQLGGKLIFDTGGEVTESQSANLPDWFPFSKSERKGLGSEWQLDGDIQNDLFKDVDITSFAPPVFDKSDWNFSYPVDTSKSTAEILLKQKDKPLLIRLKVGNGILYWSGMNLVYHVQYYTNEAESQLFVNILESLVPLTSHPYGEVKPIYKGSNQIDIKSSESGRGILVKRQMYDQWTASVKDQNTRMIKAGPSYPGFIYIPLQTKNSVDAHISYIGNMTVYIQWFISFFTVLLLMDLSLLNGRFFAKHIGRILGLFRKKTASWWEKEEG